MSRVLSALALTSSLASLTAAFPAPANTSLSSLVPISTERLHRPHEEFFCSRVLNGSMFMRTELVFGMSRSSGPDITETEFQGFIDDQVTPRFPDGLTVLSGNGQFRDSSGTTVQEKSKLLILLYPFTGSANKKVEEIRREYQAMFEQQSVLRIDEESCVSF